MVTLKIAGLILALFMGFGFTPTYLDYLPLGVWLRRSYASGRANPSFAVGAVLAVASLVPVGMLVEALLAAGSAGAVVVGYAVAFAVAALGAVAVTPPPRRLSLARARSYVAQFMDEG